MKITIICNSKTGFTKKYADWIAEEIDCSILPYNGFQNADLKETDIIVFGSRMHAGKIEYLDKIKAYCKTHPEQKLIVFITGAAPAHAKSTIEKYFADNFAEAEISSIPHFYVPGGLNYEQMGFMDKTIMKMVANIMEKQRKNSNEKNESGYSAKSSFDISSKEYIQPLVRFLEEIEL
jgi:menaquinone-dependent protoporphyrinogen IX oxidase